jgi:hypothetical protein
MVSAGDALICGKSADISFINNYDCIVRVKQGYTKCSTAVIDKDSFITGDHAIYKDLINRNYNALMVTNKGISLNGFNNGFIGGCCGKIDKNLLAFTGRIENHVDYNNIRAFCNNLGVDIISLSDKELYDYGGLLPVTQVS